MFGAFSCFLDLGRLRADLRHHLGQVGIGVFALVGAAGAAVAPVAGRSATSAMAGSAAASPWPSPPLAMVLADVLGRQPGPAGRWPGVLLDLAVQGHQVFSQREIYGLRPDARARINTVFMTTVFLGGALATGVAGVVHDRFGWTGVTLLGAALPLVGLVVWTVSTLGGRRAERAAAAAGGAADRSPSATNPSGPGRGGPSPCWWPAPYFMDKPARRHRSSPPPRPRWPARFGVAPVA